MKSKAIASLMAYCTAALSAILLHFRVVGNTIIQFVRCWLRFGTTDHKAELRSLQKVWRGRGNGNAIMLHYRTAPFAERSVALIKTLARNNLTSSFKSTLLMSALEVFDGDVRYTSGGPRYIPPVTSIPNAIHSHQNTRERAPDAPLALPERDISSPSPPPSFPLIHPPTYRTVQTIEPPPAYRARTGGKHVRWDEHTQQYRRDRCGNIRQYFDYRCLAVFVALLMFSIVIIVFVVLNKLGNKRSSSI